MLKRDRFLALSTAGTAASLTVWSPSRAAQFTYKLAHPNPVEFPPHVRMVQMAHAIKTETNGRLEIQIFPNGILGSQNALITQLRMGSVQFMQNGTGQFTSLIPVTAIVNLGFVFTSLRQPMDALDGPLGAYIGREFAAKGIFCFNRVFDLSFREMTTSSRPIRTVDDFAGLKLRTPAAPIYIDMFKALGASPVALDVVELYSALQTHLIDGQETPLVVIQAYRLSEVQKFLSITNHGWGGLWLVANMDAWNALPPDIQAVVQRNEAKYALLARDDMRYLNDSLANKLAREGFIVNAADRSGMRARLSAYYEHWKTELGNTAWSLLEDTVGKLTAK